MALINRVNMYDAFWCKYSSLTAVYNQWYCTEIYEFKIYNDQFASNMYM